MDKRFEKRFIPDTEAQRINDAMGAGFNLGNTLDAVAFGGAPFKGVDTELAWRNPRTTRQMITAIREGGFKTMRIPVTWHNHVSGEDDLIEPEWLARVQEIVGWCLDEDMFVQLNTHHDMFKGFLELYDDVFPRSKEFLEHVWQQISDAFRDTGAERLLFESMNEIRVYGKSYEWSPDYQDPECIRAMENVNRLNQVFVDTVRRSGGANAERFLIIPGYSTSVEGACWDGFKLPEDTVEGRLLVSAHVYSPAHFAFLLKDGENVTAFDPEDKRSTDPIDERHEKLYERFVKNGIPVTMNEYGTVDKNNDPERVKCLAYTVAKARSVGIQCCYWDNGRITEYGEGLAIFDRNTCTFCHDDMRKAIV